MISYLKKEILRYNSNYQLLKKNGLLEDISHITHFLDDKYTDISWSQRIWHIKNDILSVITCKVCEENPAKYHRSRGYICCSRKCSIILNKESNKNKYTNSKDEINEKIKNTSIRKYGVDHPSKSELVKDKARKTVLKKYGVDHVSKVTSVIEKKKETCKKRYGGNSSFNSPTIRKKYKHNMTKKYGVDNPMKMGDIVKKTKDTFTKNHNAPHITSLNSWKSSMEKYHTNKFENNLPQEYMFVSRNGEYWKVKHKSCGRCFEIGTNLLSLRKSRNKTICTACNPICSNISDSENDILKFIKSIYDGDISSNNKGVIKPYELDLFLPDIKLAIEFNGLYWHSDIYKDKKYHIKKYRLCENKNIKLLNLWEDDWIHKQEIVKSIISGYMGINSKIYARKCDIVILNSKSCKDFINQTHIQGFVPATTYYGLKYKGKLVQIMSFKRIKNNDWEISRLCSSLNTTVVGGSSRLLNHFLKNHNINSLMSYSLNDYFSGAVYNKLGMKLVKYTHPNYHYVDTKNIIRLSRQKFQKHKLIKEGYNPNKSEKEIMANRGYPRIYNSGNKLWKL